MLMRLDVDMLKEKFLMLIQVFLVFLQTQPLSLIRDRYSACRPLAPRFVKIVSLRLRSKPGGGIIKQIHSFRRFTVSRLTWLVKIKMIWSSSDWMRAQPR